MSRSPPDWPDITAVVGPLLGDPVAAGDALTALRRYSLVTPAGDSLMLVHRLVQHVTLARLSRPKGPADLGKSTGDRRDADRGLFMPANHYHKVTASPGLTESR